MNLAEPAPDEPRSPRCPPELHLPAPVTIHDPAHSGAGALEDAEYVEGDEDDDDPRVASWSADGAGLGGRDLDGLGVVTDVASAGFGHGREP